MVVDDDTALILGREVLGFPKKMAEIRLEESEGRAVGTVSRKGVEVMRLEAALTDDEQTPAPFFGRRMVNAIGTLVTGMKLVDLPPAAERIHSVRCGTGRVQLGSTERDPLAALEAAPTGAARLGHLDFGAAAAAGAPGARILDDIEATWTLRQFFARAR
jgi:acetoacetate decarboxylase